jgi:hypothetical protein
VQDQQLRDKRLLEKVVGKAAPPHSKREARERLRHPSDLAGSSSMPEQQQPETRQITLVSPGISEQQANCSEWAIP